MKSKINVYRVTYRLKNGSSPPLLTEIIIKTKKEKEDIIFSTVIQNWWDNQKTKMILDEILDISLVGKE